MISIPQTFQIHHAGILRRNHATTSEILARVLGTAFTFALAVAYAQPIATAQTSPANGTSNTDTTHIEATTSTTTADSKSPSARVELIFGGSLCPVCLVAFQRRLSDTPGVVSAKVESLNVEQSERSGHPPKKAHAIVEYTPSKISKAELEAMIRHNDFQFMKAQELPATNP